MCEDNKKNSSKKDEDKSVEILYPKHQTKEEYIKQSQRYKKAFEDFFKSLDESRDGNNEE